MKNTITFHNLDSFVDVEIDQLGNIINFASFNIYPAVFMVNGIVSGFKTIDQKTMVDLAISVLQRKLYKLIDGVNK
jgi:hypothetical protein